MTINMDTYCSCISSATFPAACSFAQQKTPSNPRSAFANFSTKQLSWKCCVMASANTKQGGPRRRRIVESLKGFGSKVTFTFKIHTCINPSSSHLAALSLRLLPVLLFKNFMYRYISLYSGIYTQLENAANKRTLRSPP